MTLKRQVLDLLHKTGWATTARAAKDLKVHPNRISTAFSLLLKEEKLQRQVNDEGKYAYFFARGFEYTPPDTGDTPKPVIAEKVVEPEKVTQPVEPVGRVGLDALVSQIASQLAVRVVQELTVKIEDELRQLLGQGPLVDMSTNEVRVKIPPVNDTTKAPRRKLSIIGLLPQQVSMIKNEFEDCFTLHFYSADGSPSSIAASIKFTDYVVTMCDFISHKMDDLVRANLRGDTQHIRLRGGMSHLRQKLTDIFCSA